MARTLTRTERNYSPGVLGPFAIDSFTRDNASGLIFRLRVASWPALPQGVPFLFYVTLRFSNGDTVGFDVTGPGIDKDTGQVRTEEMFTVPIFVAADGVRRAVTGATASVDLRVAIRAGFTLEAV